MMHINYLRNVSGYHDVIFFVMPPWVHVGDFLIYFFLPFHSAANQSLPRPGG